MSDVVQSGLNDTFRQYNNDSDKSKRDSWDTLQKGVSLTDISLFP